jgi:flagellar biosynthesis protein FlhB
VAEDQEQQTEDATPHKLEKMREEGQVIRSQDLVSAAVVTVSCMTIGSSFQQLGRNFVMVAQRSFRLVDAHEPLRALHTELQALGPLMVPLIAAAVAAVISGFAQSRMFSLSLLMPKLERMDPLHNLAQLIPSKTSMLELGKQVGKLLAVGYLAYRVIADALPIFATLSSEPPLSAAAAVADVAGKLAYHLCIAFVLAGAIDYYLARRKYLEDAKMSRDEVRDEHKEQEGRPEVKQAMRRRAREMMKKRAAGDISKATVVVVNPTHYAVALRYLPEKDAAPMVIAKAIDEQALAMRTLARKARVPVVEQRPLARALYADAKVGKSIPIDLYRATAEVIAYVMQLKARDAGRPLPTRGDT